MPIEAAAYLGPVTIPDELVTSIRCMVRVGEQIVVCDTPDGSHPWPGGRRAPGESHWETARREVHEETGWLIEPAPFKLMGWLHLHHRQEQPENSEYPHPDLVQLVYQARSLRRDGGRQVDWQDTEGWESASRLLSLSEARQEVEPGTLGQVFLDALTAEDLRP
jgi:8-oxo-dGTP pyrophosphatase MutT (NUDIX family)